MDRVDAVWKGWDGKELIPASAMLNAAIAELENTMQQIQTIVEAGLPVHGSYELILHGLLENLKQCQERVTELREVAMHLGEHGWEMVSLDTLPEMQLLPSGATGPFARYSWSVDYDEDKPYLIPAYFKLGIAGDIIDLHRLGFRIWSINCDKNDEKRIVAYEISLRHARIYIRPRFLTIPYYKARQFARVRLNHGNLAWIKKDLLARIEGAINGKV